MDARQALDEWNNLISKLDTLLPIRDVLAVASEAETRVRDAESRLKAVQEAEVKARTSIEATYAQIASQQKDAEVIQQRRVASIEQKVTARESACVIREREADAHVQAAQKRLDLLTEDIGSALKRATEAERKAAVAEQALADLRLTIKQLQQGVATL